MYGREHFTAIDSVLVQLSLPDFILDHKIK